MNESSRKRIFDIIQIGNLIIIQIRDIFFIR